MPTKAEKYKILTERKERYSNRGRQLKEGFLNVA